MTNNINIPEKYQAAITEKKWQDYWEEHKTYAWDPHLEREENFVIDTPPPTISGHLHMGHVFSYTQTDFVARFFRMTGKNVFYPMGFDDNGLPTERLVEKERKVRAVNMDRNEFIAICEEVVEEAESAFRALFKSVALSVDWAQEYQTISSRSRNLSQASFLDLLKNEHVYRAMQPTLWDPIDQTALAQADVVDIESTTFMNEIIFKTGNEEEIRIATTRPELLPACVAVFYNPEDSRYLHLKDKQAITPLFGVSVPIMPDADVQIDKGTGLVMCCTFGDTTDIKWWKTYDLATKIIIGKDGRICNLGEMNFAGEFVGLKVKEAREKMLEMLKGRGLLISQSEITHQVRCAERSSAPLEILVNEQWFVKVLDQKEALLRRSAECNWYPPYMQKRLDIWINGLSWDWCISRQRFFGVPFPIWYSKRKGEEGKVLTAHMDDLPVDPLKDLPRGYAHDEVCADMDVMDTWATSSISPQLSSHGLNANFALDAKRHAKLFPADLRPQAHEIIRTWAFYTIVKAQLHGETIPWKNLMISGWCLAADKTKMSKSKGNIVTPIGLLEEKSSDVVRYWASTSKLGTDTAYSEALLAIGKKLVNKLWNAAKFASIHLEQLSQAPAASWVQVENRDIFETADLWILSCLKQTVEKATKEFEKFEYCNARVAIEDFFWNDFCDNYLEIVKIRVYDEIPDRRNNRLSAVYSIYHCLNTLLKLFAPFCPHITEELYSHIFGKLAPACNGSIHAKGNWPSFLKLPYLDVAKQAGSDLVNILNVIRKFKAEKNISIKSPLAKIEINAKYQGVEPISSFITDLKNVTSTLDVEIIQSSDNSAASVLTEDGRYAVTIQL